MQVDTTDNNELHTNDGITTEVAPGKACVNFCFENPFLALNYQSQFENSKDKDLHYTQGCKWAPDGSCLIVASNDQKLRLFNLPTNIARGELNDETWITEGWKKDAKTALTLQENEQIYDYSWYPLMRSVDPNSCCVAVTCRDLPVHLWDAWTGQLVCSYSFYNHLDEMVAARSVGFSPDGQTLLCGYTKNIRIFDVSLPGRKSFNIDSKSQSGIISCLAFHPELTNIFAAGSYSGSIGLYSLEKNKIFALFNGHKKGVTHIKFSDDGTKLYSGTRKDDEILCWDMRNPGEILTVFKRKKTTNQRIYFDLSPNGNKFLVSGTPDGKVLIWDTCEALSRSEDSGESFHSSSFVAHGDCVNGVSLHPFCPILATSSGQRHSLPVQELDSSDSDEDKCTYNEITEANSNKKELSENSVKLWWVGGMN